LNEEEVMKTYYISLAAYIVVEVKAETQEAAHQSAGDLLIDSVNDLEDLDCSLVRILDVQDQEELDFVNSLNLPDDPVAGLIMLDIHKTQSTTLIIRDDESLLH
jgi:exosome complex RNA-binding protein Csl4